jgi:hypothetical protein
MFSFLSLFILIVSASAFAPVARMRAGTRMADMIEITDVCFFRILYSVPSIFL